MQALPQPSHAEFWLFLWIQIIWITAHNRAWVHLTREPRSLTSIWTELDSPARLSHSHQASQSVQTSGKSPRACPSLCNPAIGTAQPQDHHVNPKLPIHCSVLCLEPTFVNLSCSLQNPDLPEVFVSWKTSFSEHKKWLLFYRSFYTDRYVFALQILFGKKCAGISH